MGSHRAKQTFSLAAPRDLLRKLQWEIEQLQKLHAYDIEGLEHTALNGAWSAWHMIDWLWESTSPAVREPIGAIAGKSFADKRDMAVWLTDSCRELEVCRLLATAAKHFDVRDRPDPRVTASSGFEVVQSGDAVDLYVGVFISDGERDYRPSELLERVAEFWKEMLDTLGIAD